MTTVELTRFRVSPGRADQFLAARPGIRKFFDLIDELISAEEGTSR
ncbi:hypothetical protein [Nonomuraea sp. NPDC052265]